MGLPPPSPRIILRRSQIHLVEAIGAFVAEERIFEFPGAVNLPEEQTESVFEGIRIPSKPTANSQTSAHLKPLAAIRVNQLHRSITFPLFALSSGISVNAISGVSQIALRCD